MSDEVSAAFLKIADVVDVVSSAHQADIVLYSGGIYRGADTRLFQLIKENRSKPNILLLLTTSGGDPDAAYRIARHLQQQYDGGKFKLLVETICKSAGTLISIGSDEIIMCDGAELGPVDMQVWSREEVGELSSGLTPTQALSTLRSEALKHFEESFKKLRSWPMRFSTRVAAEISTKISVGLMESIYAQIDPMRLGENQRTMLVAAEYGQRLERENTKKHAVARIVSGYPSHGFMALPESQWVQIQSTAVEVDGGLEVVRVSEPAALPLDGHDFTVQSLGHAVGDLVAAVAQHVPDA